jgi:hypothetical protein
MLASWKTWLSSAALLVGVLLLLYIALVAFVYIYQDSLVYFPSRDLEQTPADLGISYEDVWLEAEDGVRLHGWYLPAPVPRATALYLHGNGDNIAANLDDAATLHDLGLNVLLIDYRGYGLSAGEPSEPGLYRDAVAAWRYLTDTRQQPPESIVLVGHSLGGAVATWLATQHNPAALVLMSTFTALPDVGAEQYPLLPVRMLSRNHYPTLTRLRAINAPVLITHGRDDPVIPLEHSQQLYAALDDQHPRLFLSLSGEHDSTLAEAAEQHPAAVADFFNSVLRTTP